MKKDYRFKVSRLAYTIGIWVLAAIFLMPASPLRAQDIYKASAIDIKVLGTSNLHNWSMETNDINCIARFIFPVNGGLPQSLVTLNVAIPVQHLKSGESLMDSRAYTALKADKFGTITYASSSATITPGGPNQFQVKSSGSMTIGGVSQPVVLTAACLVNADGSIACSGSQQVKMTDYQIKPPSFMLGALKTGDELTIKFSVTLKK